MILTDDAPTTEQPTTVRTTSGPGVAGERYRLVLDGIGARTGTVTSEPIDDRGAALAAFDRAVTVFAGDVAAGQLRVSVLTETVWNQRGGRRG